MQGHGQRAKIAAFVLSALGYAAVLAAMPPADTEPPPDLRLATSFAVLGCAGVTNSNATFISGNVGACRGAAVTGLDAKALRLGEIIDDDALTRTAHRDAVAVDDDLAARPCDRPWSAGPLAPGVYCVDAPAELTGTILLDAAGDAEAVWIFKVAGPLATAPRSALRILNGGQSCNVYWQVAGPVTLGAESTWVGTILTHDRITLARGATLSGRALALSGGAVTLDTNIVSMCCNPIAIAPGVLPDARTGTRYETTLSAVGGRAPYRYAALESAPLPSGLKLSENGIVSGTPKRAGARTLIVAVTDANGCPGTATALLVTFPGPAAQVEEVPAASTSTLLMLGALLAGIGVMVLRR